MIASLVLRKNLVISVNSEDETVGIVNALLCACIIVPRHDNDSQLCGLIHTIHTKSSH